MDEGIFKCNTFLMLDQFGFHTQFHEDKDSLYIPDASFAFNGIDGWIEVKYVDKKPKTLGSIDHYTKGQENWLINRGKKGCGACYLLVGTGDTASMWSFVVLKAVRHMPFEAAVKYALLKDIPLSGVPEAIHNVMSAISVAQVSLR